MANHNVLNVTKPFLFLSAIFPLLLSANSEIKTVGELDTLQSQTTWYKALAARNKAKDEVGATTHSQSGNAMSTGTLSGQDNHLPQISKIIGNGKTVYVRLRFPDGTEITRKKGDAIPGGFTLHHVSLDDVTLINAAGNKTILTEVAP